MKRNNKTKKKTSTDGIDPKKKKYITVAAIILGAVAMGIAVFAIVYPFANINSRFDKLISEVEKTKTPSVMITDMLADNVFAESSGEVMINDADQTKALLSALCSAADKMKYSGKSTEQYGSWDIRFTVSEGDVRVTLYLAEDRVYYTDGSVKYYFVPTDSDSRSEYEAFYGEIKKLVTINE